MYEQGENGKIEMSLMHFHVSSQHYDNMPLQYTASSYGCKNNNKNCDIFLIFAQNKDCGYTLEPPHLGSSNAYPQSMF